MNSAATKTIDLGNNESKSCGVFPQADGSFLAMTFSQSKSGFRTFKGAEAWVARKTGRTVEAFRAWASK